MASGGSGGGAAVSLLEKYSTLNSGIDDARKKRSAAQSELDTIQNSIQSLIDEREDMENRQVEAKENKEKLVVRANRARKEYSKCKESKKAAETKRDAAMKDDADARRRVEKLQITFLERCKEFRLICKRVRLEEPSIAEGGYTVVLLKSTDGSESESWSDKNSDDTETGHNETMQCLRHKGCVTQGSDDQWGSGQKGGERHGSKKKHLVDKELLSARSKSDALKEAHDKAFKALEATQNERKEQAKRADDRARRIEGQRSQLERVRDDVSKMEEEIRQLEMETAETKAMGRNYERNATGRKRMTIPTNIWNQPGGGTSSFSRNFNPPPEDSTLTPSSGTANSRKISPSPYHQLHPVHYNKPYHMDKHQTPAAVTNVNNPYKTRLFNDVQRNPYSETWGRKASGTGNTGHRQMTAAESQHPHRAGRIRTDRQFSTALEIFCGGEDADASAGPPTAASTAKPSCRGAMESNLDADDEDEDDALLSYVAFGKDK